MAREDKVGHGNMFSLIRRHRTLHHWLKRAQYAVTPMRLPRLGTNTYVHPTAMFTGPLEGIEIGNNVRIHAYAQVGNAHGGSLVIGDDTTLAPFAVVQNTGRGSSIEIGKHCSLQRYSIVYGSGPVRIGNYCRIAAHVVIVPVNKGFDDAGVEIHKQAYREIGITLEEDVWIGSGVQILDGVHLGKGCVVAAGSLVNKSFAPLSVIAGVPARLMKVRGDKAAPKTFNGDSSGGTLS